MDEDDIVDRLDREADRADRQASMAHLAELVGDYYFALRNQGLPSELVHALVGDYHMVVLSNNG